MKKNYYEVLNQYFNVEDVNELLKRLDKEERANITNDHFFAKISKTSDSPFFSNNSKNIDEYLKLNVVKT